MDETFDTPASTTEGEATDKAQSRGLKTSPSVPDLPCVAFLKTHFANSGLDGKGYHMLYRMIEMISAIDWEVHTTCSSENPRPRANEDMIQYAKCILQGCEAFRKNMLPALIEAQVAVATLPNLEGDGEELEARFKQWRSKLRTLHEPTGNDTRLFKLVLHHCIKVQERLIVLHSSNMSYNLDEVVQGIGAVHLALKELVEIAKEADEVVTALDAIFESFVEDQNQKSRVQALAETQQAAHASDSESELLAPAVYSPPSHDKNTKPNAVFSKSFSAAEEELGRHHHVRTSTFSPSDYATVPKSASLAQDQPRYPFQGSAIGSRRKGAHVPRIFTGSFSQLESDLRRLQLHKVRTPEEQTIAGSDPIKIRDFGATPAISPCTSPALCVSLQRREALLSKDSEFQNRVINGTVVKSRRPSAKMRAQTIDDKHGGLEAWLKEDPPTTHIQDTPGSAVRRGNLRHRENTL